MNRYDHTFAATCPNDSRTIIYHLTIKTDAVIKAEDIEAACFFGTAYHEAIADRLIEKFGGRQKLRALHQGVHITTVRPASLDREAATREAVIEECAKAVEVERDEHRVMDHYSEGKRSGFNLAVLVIRALAQQAKPQQDKI